MVRFIIRPASIRTTPKLLKESLGAERTLRWPNNSRHRPSWLKDFFLTYPPIEELEEYAESIVSARRSGNNTGIAQPTGNRDLPQSWMDNYSAARAFASATKPEQRRAIDSLGFPVPQTSTQHNNVWFGRSQLDSNQTNDRTYIVRPLRHTGGQGWRLTGSPTDFEAGREYIQEVYPKDHEYRIIAVRGEPLITLYKRRPEHLTFEQPWNHTNGSSFVTVHNPDNNRLRHTDIYTRIAATELFKSLDLIGLDIMLSRRNHYVITEVNLCPAITIPGNLQRIKDHVDHNSFFPRT